MIFIGIIFYYKSFRKNSHDHFDESHPIMIYATPKSTGTKSLNIISQDFADISSLSRGDINNVLINLVEQIPKYLLDGQSVQLGELGAMRISLVARALTLPPILIPIKLKDSRLFSLPVLD